MTDGSKSRQTRLSDRQRIAWLRLVRTPNVGPSTFRTLIHRYGSADAAIDALPELARQGGGREPRIASVAAAEAEIERAGKAGAAFVAIGEADYPAMLRRMEMPPPLLAVKGRPTVFNPPSVAIVGARNASLAGMKFTQRLARELGGAGFAVVSGLARGIDTAAHQGSLSTGTIACVAGGIDCPYPPQNAGLLDEIVAQGGAIVSEMPFGWQPRAQDFPRRNRLIAGLALGLVVVEAAKRSGSLISARLAGEMGRIVFAVPGSPLDPRSEGTNGLLKDGAILVTGPHDVIEAIAPLVERTPQAIARFDEPLVLDDASPPVDGDRATLVEALSPTPVAVDELIEHTGLPAARILAILLELDLAGRIERHAGGAVSLCHTDV